MGGLLLLVKSGKCRKYVNQMQYKGRVIIMESTNKNVMPVSFMQEMLDNKFLLLTVILGIAAAVYLIAGLVILLGH